MAKSSKATETQGVAVPPKKSGGNKKALVIVLVVVLLLPALAIGGVVVWLRGRGADNIAESLVESATGGDVDINSDDGDFSVKSGDGSYEISSSADLPDNFPDGVPLYDDQDITGSYRSSGEDVSSWSITAETKDSVSRVGDFFDEEFASWENQGEYSASGTTTTIYKKGDLSATVSVGKSSTDDSKTSISYLVSEDTAN